MSSKNDKDRDLLKNWYPISLLPVIEKMTSTSIAHWIKSLLDMLIDKTQTGFVTRRYMGESTRLVYDFLHYTEKSDIPVILVLIDFEKAVDSVSWKFIYKSLLF